MSRPGPRSRSKLRWLAPLALATSVVTACRVDTGVRIDVESAGAGTVTVMADLDAEAASRLGDLDAVRVEDLESGGWTVRRTAADDGGATIRASKRFGSPGDLGSVLDEVGGSGGVFRDWRIVLDDGVASTTRTVRGRVVLSGALDQFGDADLAAALDGLAVGHTPDELAPLVGPDGDAVRLDVEVRVPGAEPRIERFVVADGTAVDRRMSVSATERDGAALRWFLLAVVTAGLGVALVGVRAVRAGAARPRPEADR